MYTYIYMSNYIYLCYKRAFKKSQLILIALEEDIDLVQKTYLERQLLIKKLVENKFLVGKCVICDKRKSMIVSDNLIQADGLSDFFKNLGKKGLNVSKKKAKNVHKTPSRALDITANTATTAASGNPKNVIKSLPELITF